MKSILINFSGHKLSHEAQKELQLNFNTIIDTRPIEIKFDDYVEQQITSIINELPIKIDGSSPITIIPPGQATFAILLVSYLHGLMGHFPNLCYLERSSKGIYLPRTEYVVQPHEIRSAGRKFRSSLYENQTE